MPRTTSVESAEKLEEIRKFLDSGEYPALAMSKSQKQAFRSKAGKFKVVEGSLYFKTENEGLKLFLGPWEVEKMKTIIKSLHNVSHLGCNTPWKKLQQSYHGIPRALVEFVVRECKPYQHHEPLKTIDELQNIVAQSPFERLQMDLIDLRHHSRENDGFCWILCVLDCFSKFVFCFALRHKKSTDVCKALRNLIFLEGAPQLLHSDNGKE